jgi:acyl-coenzyme A thioesterase PaaI-like protein
MSPSRKPNAIARQFATFGGTALGRWAFSQAVVNAAPFFGSIAPRFEELEPGYVRVAMKNRRGVHNHIGSVHAIAMCNAAELVMGTCMEASLSPTLRWIPVGMDVDYIKRATTDLIAECRLADWEAFEPGDITVPVTLTDTHGDVVCAARIRVRLSKKPPKGRRSKAAA